MSRKSRKVIPMPQAIKLLDTPNAARPKPATTPFAEMDRDALWRYLQRSGYLEGHPSLSELVIQGRLDASEE